MLKIGFYNPQLNRINLEMKYYIVCGTVVFFAIAAIVLASDLTSTPDFELVVEGYWATIAPCSEAQGVKIESQLKVTPANCPPQIGHDIRSLWMYLNKRLRESGIGFKMVLESNISDERIKEWYMNAKASTYGDKVLSEAEMSEVLSKMTCLDLFSLIVENTNLQSVFRDGVIVLINHWPHEKGVKPTEPLDFSK